MTLETYLAYVGVIAVFFATPPGPSQALMIASSLKHGLLKSRFTVAGDLSANALQMLAAGFGLTALIAASSSALFVIKWLGVAYLLYIGIKTWRSSGAATAEAEATPRMLARRAFFTSAANPKAVFFFAALFPQFIDGSAPLWPQLLILGGTYLVIDGLLLFAWGGAARGVLAPVVRSADRLAKVSGAMMIAAAGLLALRRVEV
ncbi:MAG: LysE family transporter [Pseudomonadota bacterium]